MATMARAAIWGSTPGTLVSPMRSISTWVKRVMSSVPKRPNSLAPVSASVHAWITARCRR